LLALGAGLAVCQPSKGAAPTDEPGREEETAACEPRAFVPPGKAESWRHSRTGVLVVSQGSPNHRGQDVVVAQGNPQMLAAKFAYGLFDKDLEDEVVELFIQDVAPCGAWSSFGTVRTSKDGRNLSDGAGERDDGWAFFTLDGKQARGVGWHPVRTLVRGDLSQAAFSLFVVSRGTPAVVFDIDGTLTTDDSELFREMASEALDQPYAPKARDGAADVARAWAEKGYLVLYLTGRPGSWRRHTRDWLVDQGFPAGAVRCTDHLLQAAPNSQGVGRYKTDYLAVLKQQGVSIPAAYGNADTDIEAYEAAGIPKEVTYIVGPRAGQGKTVALSSYRDHLEALKSLPRADPAFPQPRWW
jgi:hypothetical protein